MNIIDTGYTPRPLQAYLHSELKRFNVLVCHRRFGKSVFSLNEMLDRALACEKKNPQYAYIGPSYGQVERIAWKYLKDFCKSIPGVKTNEQKLRLTIPRPQHGDIITFFLLSADNPDSIRGIYLDGVVLDEYGDMNPIIWDEVILPTLSDRTGWAIFIGTPKGDNHFKEFYYQEHLKSEDARKNWFSKMFKASETGVLPPEELRICKESMSEEAYAQEYECDFESSLVGAYYGKQMEQAQKDGRITKVPYDPSRTVNTYWDLGMDDHTTLWFIQKIGRSFDVIDYYSNNNQALDHYVDVINKKEYSYNLHWLPHDGNVRELISGIRRVDALKDLGLRVRTAPKPHNKMAAIDKCRFILRKCRFDEINCREGLKALKNFQKRWDATKKVYEKNPLRNWAIHGADGFQTFALVESIERNDFNMLKLQREYDTDYSIYGD